MMIVAEIGLPADAFAIAVIAAFAFYGWQQGLFVTTIAALQVLAASLVALAFATDLAPLLASFGLPEDRCLAAAYVGICAACILVIRVAVGAVVPRDAIGFARAIDTFGSAAVGGLAGLVLAGAVLVAWSMAPLPDWIRLKADGLKLDAGSQLLGTFARCVRPAGSARTALLEGEGSAAGSEDGPRSSEPFVDVNRNGDFDDTERYLDLDKNDRFTRQMSYVDLNGNSRRDFGLRECYRLAAWRDLVALHGPRLTSPAVAERKRNGDSDAQLYEAMASDVDPGDMLEFRLKADARDDAEVLTIDAKTGRVSLLDPPAVTIRKTYRFTVVVTDRHGLEAEQPVSVTIGPGRRR